MAPHPKLLALGVLLLLNTLYHNPASADQDAEKVCIPGTAASIKANLVRTLVICYVYGCPDAITDQLAKNFNKFHFIDLNADRMLDSAGSNRTDGEAVANDAAEDLSTENPPETTTAATGGTGMTTTTAKPVEVPTHVLSKLAKLTSALEKDRNEALTACTDWMSLLNKLMIDIMQVHAKCFLEPSPKYPPELPTEGEEIDCDEMTVYMRQLQKHFGAQCEGKGKDCPERLKNAVSWFGRAYKQMGKNCYYDAYDYLDK